MHALAKLDMAPKFLGHISKNGMPKNSIIVSVCTCWLVILPYRSFPMVGAPCTEAEALEFVRGIWQNAMGVE